MKKITLTNETVQQISDELNKYGIIMSVVSDNDDIGKKLGTGLFDIGFGEPGSTFYPADGKIRFIFDEENNEVSYESTEHD